MQSKPSKFPCGVTGRTTRVMDWFKFLTQLHCLFWTTQSPAQSLTISSSPFPFLSKQALGYLQQCYWYIPLELQPSFPNSVVHLIHNSPKIIHKELQYVQWYSHTIISHICQVTPSSKTLSHLIPSSMLMTWYSFKGQKVI